MFSFGSGKAYREFAFRTSEVGQESIALQHANENTGLVYTKRF